MDSGKDIKASILRNSQCVGRLDNLKKSMVGQGQKYCPSVPPLAKDENIDLWGNGGDTSILRNSQNGKSCRKQNKEKEETTRLN